jgi:tyrosinase
MNLKRITPITFRDLMDRAPKREVAEAAPLPQRKDQATLSPVERARFLAAVDVLNQRGFFGALVSIHSDMSHTMHNMGPNDPTSPLGQQRFLPWHRIYLYQFEQMLQAFDPDVTIPYWDWAKPVEQSVPSWLHGHALTVRVAVPDVGMGFISPLDITVVRRPLSREILEQRVAGLPTVMNMATYTEFATALENIHNGVHDWVGGTMDDLTTASADPIFWMHHANIDRLWSQWQQAPANQGKNPDLKQVDAIMDPWRYDELSTRDVAGLGYTYA